MSSVIHKPCNTKVVYKPMEKNPSIDKMAQYREQLIQISKWDAISHPGMKRLMMATIEHLMVAVEQPTTIISCLFVTTLECQPKSEVRYIDDKRFHELMKTADDRFIPICSQIYEFERRYNKADVDPSDKQSSALDLLPKVIKVCNFWKPMSKSSSDTDPEDPVQRWQYYKNMTIQTMTQISNAHSIIDRKDATKMRGILDVIGDMLQLVSGKITDRGLDSGTNIDRLLLVKFIDYINDHVDGRTVNYATWENVVQYGHLFPGPEPAQALKSAILTTMCNITHGIDHKIRQLIKIFNTFVTEEIERIRSCADERKSQAVKHAISDYPRVTKELEDLKEQLRKTKAENDLLRQDNNSWRAKNADRKNENVRLREYLQRYTNYNELVESRAQLKAENDQMREQLHDKSLEINHLESRIQDMKLDYVEMQMDLDKFERKHAAAESKAQTLEAAFHMLCHGTNVTLHSSE